MQRSRPHPPGDGSPAHDETSWWTGETGLEMVEYALLAALLLGVLVAIIPAFPNAFVASYTAIHDAITAALGGP